jgi:hypothetical protein
MLIAVGLWGGLSVSYETATGGNPCPDMLGLPICYLVSMGYLSMLASQLVSTNSLKTKLFYPGWFAVFVIAVLGVSFELFIADVCPQNSLGFPLCYVSFSLCVFIVIFYRLSIRLAVAK